MRIWRFMTFWHFYETFFRSPSNPPSAHKRRSRSISYKRHPDSVSPDRSRSSKRTSRSPRHRRSTSRSSSSPDAKRSRFGGYEKKISDKISDTSLFAELVKDKHKRKKALQVLVR